MSSDKRIQIGTPKPPDPKLYSNLNERQRMLDGWPYRPLDADLTAERNRVRKLVKEFNSTDDADHRQEIIRKLFHPDCKEKKNIYIKPPFQANYGSNIKVGDNFFANFDCVMLDSSLIEIGDDCMLGPGVHMYTTTHPLDPEFRKDPESSTYYELSNAIKIGNNCWIGGKAIICGGVTIGENVIVGAGAVVTKDIPSNVVVVGNPAKIIRYLDGADIPQELK